MGKVCQCIHTATKQYAKVINANPAANHIVTATTMDPVISCGTNNGVIAGGTGELVILVAGIALQLQIVCIDRAQG